MYNYHRPGVPVASDEERAEINRAKPTYSTKDIWQAVYLVIEDIELVGCFLDDRSKAVWLFDNREDRAWQIGRRFRDGGVSVDMELIRHGYGEMARAAGRARRGETGYGTTTR